MYDYLEENGDRFGNKGSKFFHIFHHFFHLIHSQNYSAEETEEKNEGRLGPVLPGFESDGLECWSILEAEASS